MTESTDRCYNFYFWVNYSFNVNTFTCMHLADAFIQSDLVHSGYTFCQYVCSLGIEPITFCAANTMLYH